MLKMDTEGKGYITYKDFKTYVEHKESRIQHLFKTLDQNQDQSIQREEVRAVLKELSLEDTEKTIEALFNAVDQGN